MVVLALVAAGAMGVALWLSSARNDAGPARAGERVLPGLQAAVNDVSGIRLTRGDGSLAALQRTATGWTVTERKWPADSGKVRKLLLDLAGLAIVEEKTQEPANYPALGVEEQPGAQSSGTRLELTGLKTPVALIVGKPSGSGAVFVRVAGSRTALLAKPQLVAEASPQRWLDTALLDVAAARVRLVRVQATGSAPWTASRAKPEQPVLTLQDVPRGRSAGPDSTLEALAAAFAGFTLEDVRDAAVAAPANGPRLTLSTFDGLELQLRGIEDGQRRFIAIEASAAPDSRAATEAGQLAQRFKGHEFEIAAYRYSTLFRPLEEMLAPKAGDGPKAAVPAAPRTGRLPGLGRSARPGDQ
jgi:hypothetical protein